MIKICMSLNNMNIVWKFHEKRYLANDLRTNNLCKLKAKAKTTSYGVESLSFRGSFVWNTLDDNVKQEPTLVGFKTRYEFGPEIIAPAESIYLSTSILNTF